MKKIIKWHDIFLIFIATSVSLISTTLLGLFDGSLFSIVQILVVSFSTVLGVAITTFIVVLILYLFGWRIKWDYSQEK